MPLDPIPTPRLDLLPLQVEHAQEMATVLADPALHTYIGGTPLTREALHARYERLVAGSPDPSVTWCNWVLRHRTGSHLIGTVQATITGQTAEIAWVVGTPWQGNGYASEAARGLVSRLRERSRTLTVIAHIHPSHHASAAVARATGLSPTDEEHDGEVRWRLSPRR
ncbi:GNAT family N-acetyltransferase [Streptomyces blattellae]|uniref:GNAT family N-acetyltransferase n=1 Tax=Streptomyces blattellae TaxID=2569855 RepID=UPI0012B821DF|nr:GNAT family N-acetyltransferase [Streptomyces blattellae]